MNPTSHHHLHLVIEGFPPDKLKELEQSSTGPDGTTEILQLTEANAREALEKMFAADTVAVWGQVS